METWIIVLAVAGGTIGTILALRIKFDVNAWLESRREAKLLKEIGKRSEKCCHAWLLYPSNPLSQCNVCHAWTSTAVLLSARESSRQEQRPLIMAEHFGVMVTHKRPYVTVTNYIGRCDS